MKVYEFANAMRYERLKDLVMVKRGGEFIVKCRMEDLPWKPSNNRLPKIQWADEHIEAVHMEAVRIPEALVPRYVITLDLATEPYPVI